MEVEMIPFLIVPDTRAPTSTAPRNSKTAAAKIACFRVRDRDETAGAKELATLAVSLTFPGYQELAHSLAPML